MEATQLMIGNLFNYHDLTVSVVEITKQYAVFAYFEDGIGFSRTYTEYDFPKPIPLTPQWLERAGFVKGPHNLYSIIYHSGDMITEVNEVGINIENGRCSISHIGYIDAPFEQSDCVYCGKEIIYLHQLQNLVKCLTGVDLEFKDL